MTKIWTQFSVWLFSVTAECARCSVLLITPVAVYFRRRQEFDRQPHHTQVGVGLKAMALASMHLEAG